MPLIKSAKKKMRQDKKKTAHNKIIKDSLKKQVKEVRKKPTKEVFQKLTSTLDKASKLKLIHPNKASRLKSRLSKLLAGNKTTPSTEVKKTSMKASKK